MWYTLCRTQPRLSRWDEMSRWCVLIFSGFLCSTQNCFNFRPVEYQSFQNLASAKCKRENKKLTFNATNITILLCLIHIKDYVNLTIQVFTLNPGILGRTNSTSLSCNINFCRTQPRLSEWEKDKTTFLCRTQHRLSEWDKIKTTYLQNNLW